MKSFIEQAQFYANYHQRIETRFAHMAGVSMVFCSLMIFLGFIKIIIPGVLSTSLASLAVLLALVYYLRLNWKLALAFTPIMLFLLYLSSWFSQNGPTKFGLWSFIISFVLGWALQFYGDYLEGRKPAFLGNLSQLIIAPLFLTAELFFIAGYMTSLKKEIYEKKEKEILSAKD